MTRNGRLFTPPELRDEKSHEKISEEVVAAKDEIIFKRKSCAS